MDEKGFDALARALGTLPTRRRLLTMVGVSAVTLGVGSVESKKKKKKKKKTCESSGMFTCLNGSLFGWDGCCPPDWPNCCPGSCHSQGYSVCCYPVLPNVACSPNFPFCCPDGYCYSYANGCTDAMNMTVMAPGARIRAGSDKSD